MNDNGPLSDDASEPIRRRKIVRFWLIFGGLGMVFVAIGLWAGWGLFSRNYVMHLLNQRQYAHALEKVRDMQHDNQDSPRLIALETQALTVMAHYDKAVEVGRRGANSVDAPDELYYWLALAEYHAGNTSASQQAAANFVKSNVTLPNGANALAVALAGSRNLSSPPDLLGFPFRLLFPVEQGTWLGFVGDEQARSGNHVLAARLYRDAFIRGHRNRESLTLATVSAALAGDFDAADIFLVYSGETAHHAVLADLSHRQGQSKHVRLRITGSQASATGGGQMDVARALAWALSRTANNPPASAGEPSPVQRVRQLYAEFPRDSVIRIFYADSLTQGGNREAALNVLQEMHEAEPSLETWLRLNGPESDTSGFIADVETITTLFAPVAFLSGDDVRVISEQAEGNDKIIRHIVRTPIEIPAADTYDITLIVRRGSETTGLQPFTISLTPDGPWNLCYSKLDQWQLCSVQTQLAAGEYHLEVSGELPFSGVSLPSTFLPEIAAILVTSPSRIAAGQ